jgi:hypothetical protein
MDSVARPRSTACDSDQTEGNHMHQDLLMKGFGTFAMPGHGMEGVFEIAIEGLNVSTHMIETGQL